MGILPLRWLRGLGAATSLSLVTASCIYDPDDRCGPNQHVNASSGCVCDDGLVSQGQSCVPCGESEVWQAGVCLCQEGYTRAESDGVCVLGGPGTSCEPARAEVTCRDEPYTICRDRGAGVGYCTSSCTADTDCPRSFVCDTSAEPSTCKSAAVGQGAPCTTAADCEGSDADYCDTLLKHVCIVVGCSVESPLSCSEGFACCDLSSLGVALTVCVPEGQCPTAS